MKRFLILLLAVMVSGCVQPGGNSLGSIPVLAEQEVLNAQARFVYLCCSQDDGSSETDEDDTPTPANCPCGGTGRSGDGIGPCECRANGGPCNCDPKCGSVNQEEPQAAVQAPQVKLIIVSGDPVESQRVDKFVCGYCERWWAVERPKLESSGWKFGPDADAHGEKITFREFNERFKIHAGNLPAFWVTVDGQLQPDSMLIGYTSAEDIANHVNGYRTQATSTSGRSTVRVITRFNQITPTGTVTLEKIGSGVVIESSPGRNVILTCHHCIDESIDTEVEAFGLMKSRKLKAKILKSDRLSDLALLEIVTDEPLPAVEQFDGDLPAGAVLSSWGCDEGGLPRFRQTTVKELILEDGVPVILTGGDPTIGQEQDPKHGRSGGGLFHQGKLVGIYSKADRARKVGFIIRVRALSLLK